MTGRTAAVERVPPDCGQAREHIKTAQRFLEDGRIEALSNESRFSMLYDAARNAITAVLTAHGIRITSGNASHAVTIREATRQLGPAHGRTLKRLNTARNHRNQLQYHTASISSLQVVGLLADAVDLVAAAAAMVDDLCESS